MKGLTWDQFIRAYRMMLGSGLVVWGTVVTATDAPSALPYIMATGLGLLGLSFSIPWERKRKNGDS